MFSAAGSGSGSAAGTRKALLVVGLVVVAGARRRAPGGAAGFSSAALLFSSWARISILPSKRPLSAITTRGDWMLPCRVPAGTISTRWLPRTLPVTLPLMTTSRASISASTIAVAADDHAVLDRDLALDLAFDEHLVLGKDLALDQQGLADQRGLGDGGDRRLGGGSVGSGYFFWENTAMGAPWVSPEKEMSGQRDLNPQHQAWEACTLPLSYARSRFMPWPLLFPFFFLFLGHELYSRRTR